MAALWAWFVGTTIGRWIVGIGAVLAAAAGLAYVYFIKGKDAQAATDEAKDAKVQADAVVVAQQVQTDATTAVAKVQADAAKQPAPDTVKRDDLNNTF